jgi:hypothetical protein
MNSPQRHTLRDSAKFPAAVSAVPSPFHIKGIAYRGAFDLYARIVPGGIEAMIDSAEDETLRVFMMQPFLSSTWYDILPFPAIDSIAARLCAQPWTRFVRDTSRMQARDELGGIYKRFLKLVSPALVAQYLPRIAAQYYNFGTVETSQESPLAVVVTRRGVPAAIGEWLQLVGMEYLTVALELSGADCVQVRATAREPDGEQNGHSLCLMRARIQWR